MPSFLIPVLTALVLFAAALIVYGIATKHRLWPDVGSVLSTGGLLVEFIVLRFPLWATIAVAIGFAISALSLTLRLLGVDRRLANKAQ